MHLEKSREGQSNDQCQVLVKRQGRIERSVEFSNKGVDYELLKTVVAKLYVSTLHSE